jgi:outer membrane protein OmpA-like peptidoglycan-associated protein
MMGQVDDRLVKKLSEDRANAVKRALVEKFKLDANKFSTKGWGWEHPAAYSNDPQRDEKNRRVEIKIYPAEKQ